MSTLVLGPDAAVGQDSATGRRAAIRRLLEDRARAFLERDEDAFMATVDARRSAFRRRQLRAFRWAAPVPFSAYGLAANWSDYGELTRPTDLDRYRGAEDVALVLVEERYRIEGIDPRPAVENLFLTFVERDGDWLIGSDSDLEAIGVPSARHLWDFGPLEEESRGHFTVLRHPCDSDIGCASLPEGFLALAEGALDRVNSYWGAPWHKEVLFLVPTTIAELARMVQATFELDNFVAFAYSTLDPRDHSYGGHRIIVKWQSFAGRPEESVLSILAHEMLHVGTRPYSGPFVPTFVEEGIAEFVGYDGDPGSLAYFDSIVGSGGFDERLPRDHEFLTGSGTDIYTSYQEGQSAVRFFVERWGWGELERFYRRLGAHAIAPGTSSYHVDRALRSTIGVGFDAFERAWADSIVS